MIGNYSYYAICILDYHYIRNIIAEYFFKFYYLDGNIILDFDFGPLFAYLFLMLKIFVRYFDKNFNN